MSGTKTQEISTGISTIICKDVQTVDKMVDESASWDDDDDDADEMATKATNTSHFMH
jgi:hypothetical protein